MSVSLTNSVDIVANSVSVISPTGMSVSLVEVIENELAEIAGNLTPDQLQNISDLSTALNDDPDFFQTIADGLDAKADKTETYTISQVDNILLNNYDTKIMVNTKISSAINNLVDAAPSQLNTLKELATALNDDANFASTVTNQISLKADKTYTDTQLGFKADKTTTYTKTEVDDALEPVSYTHLTLPTNREV